MNAFFFGDAFKMVHSILERDPFEVEDLAPAQDRWKDLVLFRCCQDKDGIGWWLFQRFQEGVKSSGRKHVYLIDDVHFEFSCLGCETYLFHKTPDIINRVVGGRIQFMDI